MMSEEGTDSRQTVTSVGNAWIVSKSKSHPDHVYYFNTATGEAVWNLSDAEIEKAKVRTKLLERNQSNLATTACSEPKDNPPLINELNKKLNILKRHQDQELEKNQQKQLDLLQTQPAVKILQTHQQTKQTSGFTNVPGNLPHFDLNALNNQFSSFNVINTPNVFNGAPNGPWAVPQAQQIFITPTIRLADTAQNSINSEYDAEMRNNSATTSRFNNFQNLPNSQKKYFHPNKKFGQGGHKNINKFNMLNNRKDLRQHILRRRLSSSNEEIHCKNESRVFNNTRPADTNSCTVNTIEDLNEHKTRNLMEKTIEMPQTEEKPALLNLTPLKRLAPSDAKPDIWYIVVDLNVLLHEFKFLTTLTDSDEQCHLLIPDQVINGLKDYIARSNNIPARRLYHSLSQRIEKGNAVIAGEPNQHYGDLFTNNILKTCLEIFQENFHVILITNDSEILSYKKFIKINMFTVDDVKLLLEGCPYEVPKKSTTAFNTNRQSIFNSSSVGTRIVCDARMTGERNISEVQQDNSQIVSKRTVDASIQTDVPVVVICDSAIEDQKPHHLELNHTDKTNTACVDKSQDRVVAFNKTLGNFESTRINSNTAELIHESADKIESNPARSENSETHECSNTPAATVNANVPKRREIKLKRSVSNPPQSNVSKANKKKPFRWRRKRDMCCQPTETVNNNNANPQTDASEKNTLSKFKDQEVDETSNDRIRSQQNSDSAEINESRESSVICMSTKRDHITIDETSTSGIISNTESIVDSESVNNNHNRMLDSCDDHKYIVMYEIEDDVMAESLATKCEEWVSRFVQIMEDVLTEVLHKEQFSSPEVPPPWSLHEAAQCIGKYSNNDGIKYITDKLSGVILNIGDTSGKISKFMSPCQFMELFSIGVSLLRAIKNITNCEDIAIAEESLQALLKDIKNPDCDFDGSIIDPYESSENVQVPSVTNENTNITSPKKSFTNTVEEKKTKYHLRSKTKSSVENLIKSPRSDKTSQRIQSPRAVRTPQQVKSPQVVKTPQKINSPRPFNSPPQENSPPPVILSEHHSPQSVKIVRNIDIGANFFTNLKLKKMVNSDPNRTNISPSHSPNVPENHTSDSQEHPNKSSGLNQNPSVATEEAPTIVRKFTFCAKFEERLKNKNTQAMFSDEEELDYEDMDEEDYPYNGEDHQSDDYHISKEEEEMHSDPNITQLLDTSDFDMSERVANSTPNAVDPFHTFDNNKKFKFVVCMFLQEISNALRQVKILCEKCYTELAKPLLSGKERNLLLKQAENANSHIVELCTSLQSTLDRNPNAPHDNIETAMEKVGVDMSQIDEHLLTEYWQTVANCKKQADVFLLAIREIVKAFKSSNN